MGNETPCFNLIHLSISFPFFHQFLLPKIDCTTDATRSERDPSPGSSASLHGRFMTASALPLAPSHSRRIVQLDGLRDAA
jgi:hypothetical protein